MKLERNLFQHTHIQQSRPQGMRKQICPSKSVKHTFNHRVRGREVYKFVASKPRVLKRKDVLL